MLEKLTALTKEQKKSFIQSYLLHIDSTDKYEVEGLDPKDIKVVDEETVEVKFENKNYIYRNGERYAI